MYDTQRYFQLKRESKTKSANFALFRAGVKMTTTGGSCPHNNISAVPGEKQNETPFMRIPTSEYMTLISVDGAGAVREPAPPTYLHFVTICEKKIIMIDQRSGVAGLSTGNSRWMCFVRSLWRTGIAFPGCMVLYKILTLCINEHGIHLNADLTFCIKHCRSVGLCFQAACFMLNIEIVFLWVKNKQICGLSWCQAKL